MKQFIQALTSGDRERLMCGEVIDVIKASFSVRKDPGAPEDEDAIQREIRESDPFTGTLPWLNDEIGQIRNLCATSGEDFDAPARTLLNAALLMERCACEEVHERLTNPAYLPLVSPMVDIWSISWQAGMSDDGKLNVDYLGSLNVKALDEVTEAKVRERIRRVNVIADRVMRRFVEEGR